MTRYDKRRARFGPKSQTALTPWQVLQWMDRFVEVAVEEELRKLPGLTRDEFVIAPRRAQEDR